MSTRYPGGIITKTPVTPAGPNQCGAAPGIWTLDQQLQAQKLGIWPTQGTAVGTKAIFALGDTCPMVLGRTTNKYTFSGDVNAVTTSVCSAVRYGSAAGNSTTGIIAHGGSAVTVTRSKYTYSGCTAASGTNASAASKEGAAAGNSTRGIFALGSAGTCIGSTIRNKYTYSGDVNAVAASASGCNSHFGAAVGSCSIGIFALGAYHCPTCGCVMPQTIRNKFTYSSCTNAGATASSAVSAYGSAAGNATVGIFALGCSSTTRNKYTYSGDVNAVATAASAASTTGAAAGNSTIGIFALGFTTALSTTRNKYTYSGCVSAAATAASAASGRGAAASDGTTGVNV